MAKSNPIHAVFTRDENGNISVDIAEARRRIREALSLSPKALADRRPLPPDVLADALQDSIHVNMGPARAVRAVRYATDEEQKAAFERVMDDHEELLAELAKR